MVSGSRTFNMVYWNMMYILFSLLPMETYLRTLFSLVLIFFPSIFLIFGIVETATCIYRLIILEFFSSFITTRFFKYGLVNFSFQIVYSGPPLFTWLFNIPVQLLWPCCLVGIYTYLILPIESAHPVPFLYFFLTTF